MWHQRGERGVGKRSTRSMVEVMGNAPENEMPMIQMDERSDTAVDITNSAVGWVGSVLKIRSGS